MKKIGIIVNEFKDKNYEFTIKIINWLEEKNCSIYLLEKVAGQINRSNLGLKETEIYEQSDFIIVLGGDGTILNTARNIKEKETPILGINMGHLGFITEVEKEDAFNILDKIIRNEYSIEERLMLEASIIHKNTEEVSSFCLNDISITKGALSRMVNLRIYINNNLVDTYNADGLLVSTPTGSTAYSLSLGGPIVSPWIKVMLITPICPHSLSSRTMVIAEDEIIRVEILDDNKEVYLTADGQQNYQLQNGDMVIIKKTPFSAKFVKVSERSFYDVLKTKIKERF